MFRRTVTRTSPSCSEERDLRRMVSCIVRMGGVSKEKDAIPIQEGGDLPPSTLHNIWFWILQMLYWVGVTILTLIYVPWALAMHVVIAALAIPFAPVFYYRPGRKVFIYFYVVTVLMPGKYIWFNAWVGTKRRGKVWDYEMGKPRAIPPDRHRLSLDGQRNATRQEPDSRSLFKLPPEVRLQIYKEVFVGGTEHVHITTRRMKLSRTSPPEILVRGYLCNRKHTQEKFATCQCAIGAHAHHFPPHESEVKLPPKFGNGRIGLLQSCKQIYAETIDLMYSEWPSI